VSKSSPKTRKGKQQGAGASPTGPGKPKASPHPQKQQPFLIVGVGASAGGLAAFKSFFATMPADIGMAFVLVQHLAPTHKSMLVELLKPQAPMPVIEARDRVKVEKNHIYVIPPDSTLTMEGGVLRVDIPAPERPHRRPIDTFFSSLAENQTDCAVGIILSGVGSDGSLGVQAIKEHGGFTLAQAEFDATAMSGMPQSATSTGSVDYVLAVEAMGAKLVDYKNHLVKVEDRKDLDGVRDDASDYLAEITGLVRQRVKHDFSGYKRNTLVRRIQRRMQVLQIETVPSYVEYLRREKKESDMLFHELLIGVTRFFRDEDAFEALKAEVLPALFTNTKTKEPIRVWVVGCATGEETYSLAMMLHEIAEKQCTTRPITVFGTDIDVQAIAFARAARYRKMDGLSADRVQRWFAKDKEDFIVVPAIRDMCVFSEHSVLKDPPFSKLDLVSCRNVLIYFDNDLQHRVIQTFHYALRSGGHLFMGPSESVAREAKLFTVIDKKHRILRRQDNVGATVPGFQRAMLPRTAEPPPLPARVEDRLDRSARRVMDKYSPAYFVIDKNHDILRFSGGEGGPYLEPSAGEASLNLFSLLRKALRPQVRGAVQRSIDTKRLVMDENLAISIDGQPRAITLIVEPIFESTHPNELFIVAFRERGRLPDGAGGGHPSSDNTRANEEALQRELLVATAQTRATSDELENHVEEMKSITEEYQSVIEELQSSNEELETSKEEMQSINEELQTVNSELHGKNDQLMQVNSDMQNLLDSTQIATIFLDDELRIRNFTPAAMDLFPLRDSDRGRALTEIVTRLTYDELRNDVRKVQRTFATAEREVSLKDDTASYIMRIRPYRTIKNVITGVVITFVDITDRKRQNDHVEALMNEMAHRTRNLFTVIQAMARLTVRHSADLKDFEARFSDRILGLSHSNDLLLQQEWHGVGLRKLIEAQLAPFVDAKQKALEITGPDVLIAAKDVQVLGLAIHELATNAAKYGALSTTEGKITLHWSFHEGGVAPDYFRLIWQEHNGPTVKPPQRRGFGSFVMEQMIKRELDATVKTSFAPDGIVWTLHMPASYAVPVEANGSNTATLEFGEVVP
jgi:two-component system, chemotaxis family, CheB/CheR fusion protein